jgi:hypothetical protein
MMKKLSETFVRSKLCLFINLKSTKRQEKGFDIFLKPSLKISKEKGNRPSLCSKTYSRRPQTDQTAESKTTFKTEVSKSPNQMTQAYFTKTSTMN